MVYETKSRIAVRDGKDICTRRKRCLYATEETTLRDVREEVKSLATVHSREKRTMFDNNGNRNKTDNSRSKIRS